MKNKKILIVDDEKLVRWSLEKELTKNGYQVISVDDGRVAYNKFCEEMPNVVLVDYKLPGFSGLELLEKIRDYDQNIPVIVMTAHGGIETAVSAMKMGAFDYITKPFNLEEIPLLIRKAIEVFELKQKLAKCVTTEKQIWSLNSIIGNSKPITEIKEIIKKVAAAQSSTILIQGESGVGKELVARAIHFESSRANEPFVAVNCSAIPETLIESELFGHEKGAFTNALNTHIGFFESAEGGTIFLDEISEMNINMQPKLLRVIEEKSIRRIGSTKNVEVDVRIITATNKDLYTLVEQNKFREDLFYRLSVVTINVPPLRKRGEDILLLSEHFLQKYNDEFKKNFKEISDDAKKILMQYHWPGNIRELKNLIERIVLLYNDTKIQAQYLKDISSNNKKYSSILNAFDIPEEGIDLEKVEEALIKKALEISDNNQTRAARLLNISRDTLRYRLKKFGIENSN